MNSKQAKRLRKIALEKNLPYKLLKKAYMAGAIGINRVAIEKGR